MNRRNFFAAIAGVLVAPWATPEIVYQRTLKPAATLVYDNVLKMWARMCWRDKISVGRAVWIMDPNVSLKLLKMRRKW